MHKKTSGILSVFLVLALCVFGILSLGGCKASDEKSVRSQLESELSVIKGGDYSILADETSDLQSSLQELGLDANQFYGALLSGFDYKINSVKSDGNTVTANVDITGKDLQKAQDLFTSNFTQWMSNEGFSTLLQGDTSTMASKGGQMLLDAINDPSISLVSTNVDIVYEKNGNSWQATDDSVTALGKALLGGYDSSQAVDYGKAA